MRDPELVVRAQLAASALEGAWHRWRVVHGGMTDPVSAVSSYVGYSLHEPWGQPRVVFGLAAEDAEQLAALIERHDCGGSAYAAVATQVGVGDLSARTGVRAVPVPRQAPLAAADRRIGQSLADVLLAGENSGYDEPVYRQAAAAMKEAAAARENASRTRPDGTEPADTQLSRDDSVSIAAGRSGIEDPVNPEWMGALARAASTAKVEAEARIRATLSDPDDEPASISESEADAGALAAADGQEAGLDDVQAAGADGGQYDSRAASGEDGRSAVPQIYATDVLEPLPTPERADGAYVAVVEEPAGAPSHDVQYHDVQNRDDQYHDVQDHDVQDHDVQDRDVQDRDVQDRDGQDRDGRGADALDGDVGDGDALDGDACDEDVSDDAPEPDDHEVAVSVQSGGTGTGNGSRGRVNRGYPIAGLSKTKRPGDSSNPAGR